MTHSTTQTLHAPQPKRKRKHNLHSLRELKEHWQQWQANHPEQPHKKKPHKTPSRVKRCLVRLVYIFLFLFLCIASPIGYLTSPMGEKDLTALVETTVNYIGKPLGLRIQLTSIRGFWEGKIQFYNLRVFDAFGPWLTIEEGNLHPQWASIAKGTLATWRYRHDKEIGETLRSNAQPLATLPQYYDNTYEQDAESQVSSQATISEDIIDPLLTAEQVLEGSVVMGLRLGTLVGIYMPRFPKYKSTIEKSSEEPTVISFLPSWFALDVGEVEVVDFQLGPTGKSVLISGRLHLQMSEKKLRLRSVLLADTENSTQLVLPPVQELPADVTLAHKQMRTFTQVITDTFKQVRKSKNKDNRYFLSFASLDFSEGDFDLRWQCRDTILTPLHLSGTKNLWARTRIIGHVEMWPPTPASPLQARLVSRFGLGLIEKGKRIRASLASGELFWDSDKLVIRDFEILSPIKKTDLEAKGSLGYTKQIGFGTQFNFSIKDISVLASAMGVDVQTMPIDGNISGDFYVSRGGEYMLWWGKPLPAFQIGRALPGFTATPHDYSFTAKNVQRYSKHVLSTQHDISRALTLPLIKKAASAPTIAPETTSEQVATLESQVETIKHLPFPRPSINEDALRFRLKLEAPEFISPSGSLTTLFFTVHGTSVDARSAPAGTNYPRKALPKIMSDFTASGLPRGLIGTTFLRIGDTLGLGPASYTSSWFVGGAHDESDVFQARIGDTKLDFPGISSTTDLSFAFALPRVKRRWPWVDGNLSLSIKDWTLLERIFDTSTHIENFQFASSFKSFLDETGRPAQYMNTIFSSDRIDSTKFMVRSTKGTTESKNLHALADTVALASGKLREALTRKMDYTPPKDYKIFNANLTLSSGRGGSVRWNTGVADMFIAGEDADFSVKMIGDINALLEGIFHFRTRTLKLKDIKISTPTKE